MTALEVILTCLSIMSGLCAIVFGFLAFRRGQKKDDVDQASERGTMLTNIGGIKSGIEDIKAELREQRKTNADFLERLVDCEASARSAHKRIDGLENRINHQ